jgi:hypothetical protein
VEVVRLQRAAGEFNVHAADAARRDEIVRPRHHAARADQLLGGEPADGVVEIVRGGRGGGLFDAAVLAVVGKLHPRGAAADHGRLVVGGVAGRHAIAAGAVALGVIGEGGVDQPAGDAGDGVRLRLAGGRVGVGANVGLRRQIAGGAVGVGLGQRCRRQIDRRRCQPVEAVIAEGFAEPGIGVGAGREAAEDAASIFLEFDFRSILRLFEFLSTQAVSPLFFKCCKCLLAAGSQ